MYKIYFPFVTACFILCFVFLTIDAGHHHCSGHVETAANDDGADHCTVYLCLQSAYSVPEEFQTYLNTCLLSLRSYRYLVFQLAFCIICHLSGLQNGQNEGNSSSKVPCAYTPVIRRLTLFAAQSESAPIARNCY